MIEAGPEQLHARLDLNVPTFPLGLLLHDFLLFLGPGHSALQQ